MKTRMVIQNRFEKAHTKGITSTYVLAVVYFFVSLCMHDNSWCELWLPSGRINRLVDSAVQHSKNQQATC